VVQTVFDSYSFLLHLLLLQGPATSMTWWGSTSSKPVMQQGESRVTCASECLGQVLFTMSDMLMMHLVTQ
jgi:hypothetical protein